MNKQIKVTHDNDNRIFNAPQNFSELITKIATIFTLPTLEAFNVYYIDSDGDLIIVSNQDDYALAFEQSNTRIRFYVGASADAVRQSIISSKSANTKKLSEEKPNPEFELINSEYQETKEIGNVPQSTYVCMSCEGKKTNRKGTKPCRVCKGTGFIPQSLVDKIKNDARIEFTSQMGSQLGTAATQVIEKKAKEVPLIKSAAEGIIYKIESQKVVKNNYRSTILSESLKDGYVTTPGSIFEKVWVMKNTGIQPWPKDTVFKIVSGDLIDASVTPVGEVQPNQTVEIIVEAKAPSKPGRYVSYFRLLYNNGETFGQKPWIDFVVSEKMNDY